jgi:hypothetical protein
MRILGVRRQYLADHSSTNYLFYAAKPLGKESRAIVSRLSSHVDVEPRTARITYHYEGADLGEERRVKFLEHYAVEVREDYDWWSLSVMLDKERLKDLDLEQYTAEDEASLTFEEVGPRVRLRLESVHLDYGRMEYGDEPMDSMAELGLQLREELYAGKTDALAVLKHYCGENAKLAVGEDATPVGKELRDMLETLQ